MIKLNQCNFPSIDGMEGLSPMFPSEDPYERIASCRDTNKDFIINSDIDKVYPVQGQSQKSATRKDLWTLKLG